MKFEHVAVHVYENMTSLIMGIVGSRSRSWCDFYLYLPQCKLSGSLTQFGTSWEAYTKHVCLSDNNTQYL